MSRMSDVEFMAFPRITGIAEVAWSPRPRTGAARDTGEFFERVAAVGRHLDELGIAYYPVRGVTWR